ncbi:alpha-hydroxy acid oxidase [Hydrogenophaga laconesensis]|uniref:Isopentenyl diphosphate isomerase/L-lactate dehydrogenase-like FMN-dependent dehydrogenase n=1 Tax=Hydrogenophaga laconesensis TaxID=1805971 RepID=A0ABU1VAX0_9BURK|nr:alpha-hydroxy acid oxidase [Hydrogenophaga laconesensis]MDR7094609.1 isopentenyl diphosphate isomerase/L-lactate dehydrogenase-like FMN-dependent dehydrogenase [Hydrogenophaga laconesensis]
MSDPASWLNSDDIRAAAQRRLPKGLFEFIDRGAEDELALRLNRAAIQRVKLRSSVLRDVSQRSTASTLLGNSLSMPVVIAPTGPAGQVWYRGEIAMARAAAEAGIPFTVSTASTTRLETIREVGGGRQWFQLYIWPDRAMSDEVVSRARESGYDALVVTADSVVATNRPFNVRNGFTLPLRLNLRNCLDVIGHPRWLLEVIGRYIATTGMPRYENYPGHVKARMTAQPIADAMAKNDSITWEDLRRLRNDWPGQLIVKGILNPEDAVQAMHCGADGIVVSNHGGIVFDSSVAPIDALPAIANAIDGRIAVLVDSGFRRGSEVVKAIALGADAVMLGRVPLYALAAAGQAGAARALTIIQAEILHTLALLGCKSIDEVGPQHARCSIGA